MKVMVCDVKVITNVRVKDGAALKLLLPACEAVIEQRPRPSAWTTLVSTVQTEVVFDVKVTARPEDALAAMD